MSFNRSFNLPSAIVVLSFVLAAGCGPKVGTLALKFTPERSTTYKLITESIKGVEFEGSMSDDPTLKGGHTGTRIEMVFSEQIESVDETGNATARITIDELKYASKVKDEVDLDFDSTRDADRESPLAKLIGQHYRIKIAPGGQIVGISDLAQARQAVRGSSIASKTGSALLKTNIIKQRHGIAALPDSDNNELRVGDNWTRTKKYSFGLMGAKTYEKIYTVKELKGKEGNRTAVIEMQTIPAEKDAKVDEADAASPFSSMTDSTDTYTGEFILDLTTGRVKRFIEELRSEWIIVDPTAGQEDSEDPGVLTMSVVRLHNLEQIN